MRQIIFPLSDDMLEVIEKATQRMVTTGQSCIYISDDCEAVKEVDLYDIHDTDNSEER
jgi:hypothetical protein